MVSFGKEPSFGKEKPAKKEKKRRPIRNAALSILAGVGGTQAVLQPAIHWNEIRTHLSEPLRERNRNTREVRELIEARYGIKVTFDIHPLDSNYESTDMTSEDAMEALGYLLDALASYPPDFFERNQIEEIVLVSNLRQEHPVNEQYIPGGDLGGYAQGDLRRFVVEHQSSQGEFKQVFDHELFHVLERINNTEEMRRQWDALEQNCSNCYPYGTVPATPPEGTPSEEMPINPFVNTYGSFNPREDRASYAEMLFTPLTHAMLIDWIASSWTQEERAIRQAKYDLLVSAYEEWSEGVMNEAYWADIIRVGREEQAILFPHAVSAPVPGQGTTHEWYVPYASDGHYEPYIYEYENVGETGAPVMEAEEEDEDKPTREGTRGMEEGQSEEIEPKG